eukprot:GHVS01034357.1.p1 GENE.GHVS01034357.1~~GHVS01034357.1.p1  ORF type:complete len:313 (-),score=33.28 GHVS01034357.1:344-1282(-)
MTTFDIHRSIVLRTNALYRQLGLQPFILSLPLHGSTADMNKKGIRDKILKNRSYIATEYNLQEPNLTSEVPEAVRRVDTMVESLSNKDVRGFILVITEVLPEQDYRPVAGAVVELVDDHERSIRGMWCRRSLPSELVSCLLKVTTIRLFAHAFELAMPGQKVRNSNKLVSTLETACLSFPREAADFLATTLEMSKHWETETDAGTHSDHPTLKCKCKKLDASKGAWQFWGISETRFIKTWKSNEYVYVPQNVPEEYRDYFLYNPAMEPLAAPAMSDEGGGDGENGTATPDSKKKRKRERDAETEQEEEHVPR